VFPTLLERFGALAFLAWLIGIALLAMQEDWSPRGPESQRTKRRLCALFCLAWPLVMAGILGWIAWEEIQLRRAK
jgi:hypothetical protein